MPDREYCAERNIWTPTQQAGNIFLTSICRTLDRKVCFTVTSIIDHYRKLQVAVPDIYKECIETCSLSNENNPSTTEGTVNQILWNNRFIYVT